MHRERKCTKNNIGTDVVYYIYCGLWQSLLTIVSRQSFTVAILKTRVENMYIYNTYCIVFSEQKT